MKMGQAHFYDAGITLRQETIGMTGSGTSRGDSRGAFVGPGFPQNPSPQISLDGFTGLDYADQRYYASSYGRFNTADTLASSAVAKDPGTWNRYA